MTDIPITAAIESHLPANADELWLALREQNSLSVREAFKLLARSFYRRARGQDQFLSPSTIWAVHRYLARNIGRRQNFAAALSNRLSRELALENPDFSARQLGRVFNDAYRAQPHLLEQARADLVTVARRDPAVIEDDAPLGANLSEAKLDGLRRKRLSTPLLHFKGYKALQTYRAAHVYWEKSQDEFLLPSERLIARTLAEHLQSVSSKVYTVDIHPKAVLGEEIGIDHATGVVIGATAEVGDRAWILHGATLGGGGEIDQVGEKRHPTVGKDVLIGAGAGVFGNRTIGDGAKLAARTVVINDVEPGTTAVGQHPNRTFPNRKGGNRAVPRPEDARVA